jgi:hypothetical protein
MLLCGTRHLEGGNRYFEIIESLAHRARQHRIARIVLVVELGPFLFGRDTLAERERGLPQGGHQEFDAGGFSEAVSLPAGTPDLGQDAHHN